MNKLKAPVSEGWMIQVYGQDRRLLCALEPSHSWTFLAGLIFGIGVALTICNLSPAPHRSSAASPASTDFTAPLMLD